MNNIISKMFKSFIKSAELTSTDGVHHNKEKYFENIEKNLKKNEGFMKSGDQLESKLIEDEEDESWRINIFKPSEEELKFRSSFEKNRVQEEKEKIIEEKEMINNFKKAQANLIIKKNLDSRQKYNQLELLNNTSNHDTKSLNPSQNMLLKIKKRPDNPLELIKEIQPAKEQLPSKSKQTFIKECHKTKSLTEKAPINKSLNQNISNQKNQIVKLNKFFEAYNSDSENEKEKKKSKLLNKN